MKLLSQQIKTRIPILSLILSIIVSWMVFPIVTSFPMVGFTILFTGVSSLVYLLKKDKTWIDSVLYFGVLSLSFFTILRASEFLQFFDFIFIIFSISILVRPLIDIQGLFRLFLSPLTVFFNTLTSVNIFKYTFKQPLFIRQGKNVKEYASAIVVTAVVLLATIPLLASANPIFNNLIRQTFEVLNIDWLLQFFATDSIAIYVLRIAVLLFLSFMIPRLLTVTEKGVKEYGALPSFSTNYLIPKIALAGTLIIFFITQLQLYFASPALLESLGYTNARLTQEVFAQVTLVAFIVLLLTYQDKSRKQWNSRLTYILLLQAFFLIGIAFKSVYDYSAIYGLTQKRLWGYASMSWLTIALSTYMYHFYKKTPVQAFIKQLLAFSIASIFMINVLNFDLLIFQTAKPGPTGEIDYNYIAQRSADAHHYTEVLPRLINDIQKSNVYDQSKVQAARKMIRYIDQLRNKYNQNYVNSFNFAEYQEYNATKQMDIKAYEKMLANKQLQQKLEDKPSIPIPTQ